MKPEDECELFESMHKNMHAALDVGFIFQTFTAFSGWRSFLFARGLQKAHTSSTCSLGNLLTTSPIINQTDHCKIDGIRERGGRERDPERD